MDVIRFSAATQSFYPYDIEYASVPTDVVDVPITEFNRCINRGSDILSWDGEQLILTPAEISTDQKISKIQQAAAAEMASGFDCDILGDSYHYPSTMTDQHNLNTLVTHSLVDPTAQFLFPCRHNGTEEWARRSHTYSQIRYVGLAAANHILSIQTKRDAAIKLLNEDKNHV